MNRSVRWALYMILAGWLALATPTYAQEGDTTVTAPTGIGVLILFMGLAALALIGAVYYSQTRAETHPEEKVEEE